MGSRVLIIEDAQSLSRAIQAELKQQYEIPSDIASSLSEAKEILALHRELYFIATVDMQLPDCQAGEALNLTNSVHLPSIVFTGVEETNLRDQFKNQPLVDYVFKSASTGVRYVAWLIQRVLCNQALKVLVVDDSPSARGTLKATIETQGFHVLEAATAKECLGLLEQQPDIIILDEYLTDALGHELCRDIRIKTSNPLLQIIGVSSKGDENTASIFLKCGGDDFISRPFNPEEFTHRLNHRADYIDQVRAHRKASEEKNRFLGMAAHDLRNPLSFIQQACRRIEKIIGDHQDLHPLIDMLQKNTKNMQVLLDDLLDISAIEMGRLQLHALSINLTDIVKERMMVFEELAAKKHIQFDCQLSNSAMVEVDPTRITQVVDNLISNAVKYSPEHSTITVSVDKTERHVSFHVFDTGPGIRPEDEPQLFKTFQRLGHQTTGGESSHGLGLAICLRIVNAHNGRLAYMPNQPSGSHFFFELPR